MTGPRTLGTAPRDYALVLARAWSERMARGVALSIQRAQGARAGEVWALGEAAGLPRVDVDAALVWLAARGVLRELVEVETSERPQRYSLALSLARLDAWVARESRERLPSIGADQEGSSCIVCGQPARRVYCSHACNNKAYASRKRGAA